MLSDTKIVVVLHVLQHHGERVADLTTLAAARVVREARSWEGRREACMRDMASTRSHPM